MSAQKTGYFEYALEQEHLSYLQERFGALRNALMGALLHRSQLTPLHVAYERYRDGLFYNLFEKQVASAVMGLEALYTESEAELSYRLRMRVARLLRELDGRDVEPLIKLAYSIRSDYAHGGVSRDKNRKKVQQEYGSEKEFAERILNILRISVLIGLANQLHIGKKVGQFRDDLDRAMVCKTTSIAALKVFENCDFHGDVLIQSA